MHLGCFLQVGERVNCGGEDGDLNLLSNFQFQHPKHLAYRIVLKNKMLSLSARSRYFASVYLPSQSQYLLSGFLIARESCKCCKRERLPSRS